MGISRDPQRSNEDVRAPGPGVKGSWEPLGVGAVKRTRVLWKSGKPS